MSPITRDPGFYRSLPYPILLTPIEDGEWFAEIPLLKGCWADGKTPDEAVTTLREVQATWIEIALERGIPIKEPELEKA